MAVGLIGSGPAVDAVSAALADVDDEVREVDPSDLEGSPDLTLAVAVGKVGEDTLPSVDEMAVDADLPWIGVELGGVGGYPVVDAAITGFGPESGCYACLQGRVAANVDPDHDPAAAPPAHVCRFAGAIAGSEAASYLADDDESVFGTVREVPHAERTLLPLPNCGCTAAPDGKLELSPTERSLESALGRAERALDDRVGPIQGVGETASFPVPYYLARLCETGGFSDATAARDAAGVALDWDAAFMKALGEALERYCAGIYRVESLQEGSPTATDGAVAPSAFVCPDEPDTDASIRWVPGQNLHTTGKVLLPAEFVHYPPPSRDLRPAITTGLGLGNGGVEAVLAGLYEVIERDAAVLAWYSTYDPLGLSVADEGFETMAARARSEDLKVTPLLLTQDVDVPVVAVAVHREEWPRFAVGSAADLDADGAARAALAEALQNWMELRGMGPEGAAEASGEIGQYAEDPGAASAFVDPETTVPAESVGPGDVPSGTDALDEVLERLEAADLRAYTARTTTTDVAQLGFEACRTLVPAAQPLFFGEPYFGERATSVPEALGYEPLLDREHHPFP